MAEEKKEAVKPKVNLQVVAQLPTQNIRTYKDEDGKEHEFITIEEALSELLTSIREIKKAVI